MMVEKADLVICDSINIEKYIKESYGTNINTTYIAYGAETRKSKVDEAVYEKWLEEHKVRNGEYYLVVGRFVPENNYETMIREFIKSNSTKDFILISNVNEAFLDELEQKTGFKKDKRIKFVGTVYDQELLKKIRESAYGYFHGHEVGGTNPSLIEALGSTDLNLLLGVGFNQEVGLDAAFYWTKKEENLAKLINDADNMTLEERQSMGEKAKKRIKTAYSWEFICGRYKEIWETSL
jgi:rhamnosyltransferase